MTKKILKNIEIEIQKCKHQLKDLEPFVYQSAGVAESYNRILVKKAILLDKYKKIVFKKPSLFKLFELFKFRKKQKLISDYFPNV